MTPEANPDSTGDDTESDTRVHVHHLMTGTFPLRVADVCFTHDAVEVLEYGYLTPLFGLVRGASTAAETARKHIEQGGLDALRAYANTATTLPYADVSTIRLYDGGAFGRPKLSIETTRPPPYAYRIHAPVDIDALESALASIAEPGTFDVTRHTGLGYSPLASIHRFVADR